MFARQGLDECQLSPSLVGEDDGATGVAPLLLLDDSGDLVFPSPVECGSADADPSPPPQYAPSHQITEFLSGTKEQRGIGALVFLLIIAISSAGPLRRFSYPAFFVLHYVGIIGFLVFVNKHTIYAQGWATYAVVGIYGVDVLGRLAGMRVRYVEVEAMEGGMVRVAMRGLHGGWRCVSSLSSHLSISC